MKLSIALCTYNGEAYIKEQLNSLIQQSRLPDEIVVSDDGSTDQTLTIVESILSTTSIPYYIHTHPKKLGVFKNFEWCMNQCKGDIIFPCDQDDVWKLDKLKRHEGKHLEDQAIDLVYSNADVVLNDIENYLYPLWNPKEIQNQMYSSIPNIVYKGRSIAGFCMSIRKDFFTTIQPIPETIYHDDWCATCASLKKSIYGISDSLAYYRQHDSNVVGIIRGSKLSYWKSLLTNVPFYVQSNTYIANRNHVIFNALLNTKSMKPYISVDEFTNMELSYDYRTFNREMSFFEHLNRLTDNLIHHRYKYHHGFFTYLKDIYNLCFMKLFVRTK